MIIIIIIIIEPHVSLLVSLILLYALLCKNIAPDAFLYKDVHVYARLGLIHSLLKLPVYLLSLVYTCMSLIFDPPTHPTQREIKRLFVLASCSRRERDSKRRLMRQERERQERQKREREGGREEKNTE